MHIKNIFGTDLGKFDDAYIDHIIALVKERCILLSDFKEQAGFFFQSPETIDTASLQSKWDEKKKIFFTELIAQFNAQENWNTADLEQTFKALAAIHELKQGELMLPVRIMLVGGKFGPTVFEIAALIGKSETANRIKHVLNLLS